MAMYGTCNAENSVRFWEGAQKHRTNVMCNNFPLKQLDNLPLERQEIFFGTLIGERVCKNSNKPFKSGDKINTVKGVVVNEHINKYAFIFEEDDSNVECWRCTVIL